MQENQELKEQLEQAQEMIKENEDLQKQIKELKDQLSVGQGKKQGGQQRQSGPRRQKKWLMIYIDIICNKGSEGRKEEFFQDKETRLRDQQEDPQLKIRAFREESGRFPSSRPRLGTQGNHRYSPKQIDRQN